MPLAGRQLCARGQLSNFQYCVKIFNPEERLYCTSSLWQNCLEFTKWKSLDTAVLIHQVGHACNFWIILTTLTIPIGRQICFGRKKKFGVWNLFLGRDLYHASFVHGYKYQQLKGKEKTRENLHHWQCDQAGQTALIYYLVKHPTATAASTVAVRWICWCSAAAAAAAAAAVQKGQHSWPIIQPATPLSRRPVNFQGIPRLLTTQTDSYKVYFCWLFFIIIHS